MRFYQSNYFKSSTNMKKQAIIEEFTTQLSTILTTKDKTALPSVPRCVQILKDSLAKIKEEEITAENIKTLWEDFKHEIDAASRSGLRGKAAYYSKTTLKKIKLLDPLENMERKDREDRKGSDEIKKLKEEPETLSFKDKMIEIFHETKKNAESNSRGLDAKKTKHMIASTVAYRSRRNDHLLALASDLDISRPSDVGFTPLETVYQVLNQDSFVIAKLLLDAGCRPLVLNMANKISIGGGVENGSLAQEESLFRCSNYHLALYPHGKLVESGHHRGRLHYKHEIREFGCYYTPEVQVFRDSTKDYAFITPFSVACIAIAGYDLAKPEFFEKSLLDKHDKPLKGEQLFKAFEENTKIKIRHLLEVALFYGHDSLILGAISCGAFRLPGDNTGITASHVAKAYQDVLEEPRYHNRFKNISFAVLALDKIGELNLKVFQDMVTRLAASAKPGKSGTRKFS